MAVETGKTLFIFLNGLLYVQWLRLYVQCKNENIYVLCGLHDTEPTEHMHDKYAFCGGIKNCQKFLRKKEKSPKDSIKILEVEQRIQKKN